MADVRHYVDLFAEFGPIATKRFFGGIGLCADRTMFAMVFDDVVYFKTDAETRKAFVAEKCKPFTFEKKRETIVTGWYALPDRLYDDPEELARWARAALAVAEASPTAQKRRKRASAPAKKRRA